MVNEDDPVCIIEVMKLFNTVKAGIRGRIAQICAEQGQMVEFQQILFLVEKISEEKDHSQVSPACKEYRASSLPTGARLLCGS